VSLAVPVASETPSAELRRLVALAWPVVLGQLGIMAMTVVDVMVVGHLGEDALGSVALGHTWTFGVSIVAMGTASGLDPLIAQAFGAGDRRGAGLALLRGLVLVTLLAIPTTALHLVAEPGLRLMGQPEDLLPVTGQYCAILAGSVLPMLWFGVLRQFLQGAGQMRPAAVTVGVANVVNLVLCWGLVYGKLGLPELGAAGAGWATFTSRWFMLLLLAFAGSDLVRRCWPGWRDAFDLAALGRAARIGLPVGLQVGMEVWAFTGTTLLVGLFGKTAVGAHMVALNLSSVSFMFPFGISAAAATRVGNLLGAGQPWGRAAWTAVGLGAGVMTVSALLFASFPAFLAGLYTDEAPVILLAATLLPVAAIFQLFDGTQAVCFGVLRGAGDTRVPALANLVGYYLVGIPVGATLAFRAGWGPMGLWVGLVLGLGIVASLLVIRLRWTVARGGFRVVG
jgi:MATE family multidrug resistance protein